MLEKRLKNAEKMPKNRGRFLNLFSYMKSVFFFAFYHLAFLRDSERFYGKNVAQTAKKMTNPYKAQNRPFEGFFSGIIALLIYFKN